jgi:peroxiredoxin-like protein
METAHYYDVNISWESNRKGLMSSPVLNTAIEAATPPEFPKGIPGIWSPEHLLVAAANSCLMTTFLAIAENSNLPFISFDSKASGKLEKVDGKFMISEITLSPVVVMEDESQKERMERVLQKSEAACLISNSLKSKIIFQPEVRIEATHHVTVH